MLKDASSKVEIITKEKTIETITRTCDICNGEIEKYEHTRRDGHCSYPERDFEYYEFDFDENNVIIGKISENFGYSEGCSKSGEIFDICDDCYENKVKKLLKETYGVIPRKMYYCR